MVLSAHRARRLVAGAIGAGVIAGSTMFGALPSALADDPPPPPNCTAADLAGVAAGVAASTSAYLFSHPDVNGFFTSLKGLTREEMKPKVKQYFNDNPTAKADLQGIRQPLVDQRERCGATGMSADNES